MEARGTKLMSPWPTSKRTELGGRRANTDVSLAYKVEHYISKPEGLH